MLTKINGNIDLNGQVIIQNSSDLKNINFYDLNGKIIQNINISLCTIASDLNDTFIISYEYGIFRYNNYNFKIVIPREKCLSMSTVYLNSIVRYYIIFYESDGFYTASYYNSNFDIIDNKTFKSTINNIDPKFMIKQENVDIELTTVSRGFGHSYIYTSKSLILLTIDIIDDTVTFHIFDITDANINIKSKINYNTYIDEDGSILTYNNSTKLMTKTEIEGFSSIKSSIWKQQITRTSYTTMLYEINENPYLCYIWRQTGNIKLFDINHEMVLGTGKCVNLLFIEESKDKFIRFITCSETKLTDITMYFNNISEETDYTFIINKQYVLTNNFMPVICINLKPYFQIIGTNNVVNYNYITGLLSYGAIMNNLSSEDIYYNSFILNSKYNKIYKFTSNPITLHSPLICSELTELDTKIYEINSFLTQKIAALESKITELEAKIADLEAKNSN